MTKKDIICFDFREAAFGESRCLIILFRVASEPTGRKSKAMCFKECRFALVEPVRMACVKRFKAANAALGFRVSSGVFKCVCNLSGTAGRMKILVSK